MQRTGGDAVVTVEASRGGNSREPQPEDKKGEPVVEALKPSYNPFTMVSSHAKVGALVILTGATALIAVIIKNTQALLDFELTNGQVAALLVSFCVILWHVCFRALVLRDRIMTGEDHSRRYLSEDAQNYVGAAAEFAALMLLFFVCDRTPLIPRMEKHFNRDLFWFLWSILAIAAFCTYRKAKPPAPPAPKSIEEESRENKPLVSERLQDDNFHVAHLQRDQTEEWKGWMQIMFLWYHYFHNVEIYNAIRLYIAAYVWMTGFGNFSYYYIRKDFTLARFLQMQWRLNFMVFWTCAILNNEYMLYYICMLHTTFTVFIYAGLGLWSRFNATTLGITVKIGILFVISAIIWEPAQNIIFDKVWAPFYYLVRYNDPYNKTRNTMQEWFFRSWLDHYIWIVGMICAYNHPNIEKFLIKIDKLPNRTSNAIKIGITAVALVCCYFYYVNFFSLPKKEYNKVHPYTAWIPILLFIVLRNISSTARRYHLHLFEWCGKITLETYIAQFHIWMGTTGINGAPKQLLRVLPEEWPLINFIIMSALLVYVSLRLFTTTNILKNFVLPYKVSNAVLLRNLAFGFAGGILTYGYAFALNTLLSSYSA